MTTSEIVNTADINITQINKLYRTSVRMFTLRRPFSGPRLIVIPHVLFSRSGIAICPPCYHFCANTTASNTADKSAYALTSIKAGVRLSPIFGHVQHTLL